VLRAAVYAESQEAGVSQASTELLEIRRRIDAAMGALPLADGTTAIQLELGGVPAVRCTATDRDDRVLLYFHGGGYRMGSASAWSSYGSHLAAATGVPVLLVDYRLAPEYRFPAAVDDAVAAYRGVLDRLASSMVVVGGDSAGGGLAAALVLAARAAGLSAPAGLVCCSPWADLTNEASSFTTRAQADVLFSKASADEAAGLYLGASPAGNPLASPVFGDWGDGLPVLVQVGGNEVLLDDAAHLASVISAAGGRVVQHVFPGMPHVFQLAYPASAESVAAVGEIAAFVNDVTGGRDSVS
jgi:monoterpene epsilon-lactone hydrolase